MLLNWLPSAADVGPFLDVFLLPFMRRRSLNIDDCIYNYILVSNSSLVFFLQSRLIS